MTYTSSPFPLKGCPSSANTNIESCLATLEQSDYTHPSGSILAALLQNHLRQAWRIFIHVARSLHLLNSAPVSIVYENGKTRSCGLDFIMSEKGRASGSHAARDVRFRWVILIRSNSTLSSTDNLYAFQHSMVLVGPRGKTERRVIHPRCVGCGFDFRS
jgi:predicted Zn-ribbon and HTH transcriptional regulator